MTDRRAIEALRAGVPNKDAVFALGCEQPEIEDRFRQQLAATRDGGTTGAMAAGLLVSGDFGAGKSHLLEYLQHVAEKENFITSKVVISKETPLHDPVKLFRAAVRGAVVPGRRGAALTEIATGLPRGGDAYRDLDSWANDIDSALSQLFPASVFLFQKSGPDTEVGNRIISFWSGDPISVIEVKKLLRTYAESATYRIEPVKARELALQRFRFVPRLAVTAGYSGWVLLVDEVELIGNYSPLQRGKSYAELARWMGKVRTESFPCLCTVFAIMSNFETDVLDGKNDLDSIPERLKAKGAEGAEEVAKRAEMGMRVIKRDKVRLRQPNSDVLQQSYDKVREIHAKAHGWEPSLGQPDGRRSSTAMREHVRKWINEWDLQRLYPGYTPATVIKASEVAIDYAEDPELEKSTPEDVAHPDD